MRKKGSNMPLPAPDAAGLSSSELVRNPANKTWLEK